MPVGLNERIGQLTQGGLERAGGFQGFESSPQIQQLTQLLQQLMQERQGLVGQLQGLQGLPQVTPEIQQYAQQAAFAPLQGLQPALQDALLQASNAANQRGLSRSSIAAAMQAQAVPRVMGPAFAQAQGRMGELLMQIPLQQRQLMLQGIQTGQGLFGAGLQGAGAQQGLRESAFNQLQQALSRAAAERDYQKQQKSQGGLLRKILGAGLGTALSFIPGVGPFLGPAVGGAVAGGGDGRGGGFDHMGLLNSMRANRRVPEIPRPDLSQMPGYGPYAPPGFSATPSYGMR